MPLTRAFAVRATAVTAVLAAAVGVVVATAVSDVQDSRQATRASAASAGRHAAPGGVEGPPLRAATVLVRGSSLTCPKGAVPSVQIQTASFAPTLAGGTRFLAGTYRIRLRGTVVNETTSPIRVGSVRLRVRQAVWRPDVRAPHALAANSSAPLTVSGTWRVRHAGPARIDAHLDWSWASPSLRPCGTRGLIEDD